MAEAISSELIKFKDTVGGSLSTMESTLSTIVSKITELISITSSTKFSVSSVYSSKNKDTVLSKFEQINEIHNKINTSLENDLKTILNKSKTLVEKVKVLEEIKIEIENAESQIANAGSAMYYNSDMSNKAEVDAHNSRRDSIISQANSVLSVKRPEFSNLHNEALAELSTLKSMDSTLEFVSEFSSLDITSLGDRFIEGEMVKLTYTASNGVKITYHLYVPKYTTEVTGLPVHMYLHGDGQFAGGALTTSLPKLLNDNVLNPNGIVICPQGNLKDGSYQWKSKEYRDALIELTNKVVAEYNADADRISLSGHSRGAIVGYQLLSENPKHFSAFVPVSGYSKGLEAGTDDLSNLTDVNIWAFHGSLDETTDYSKAQHVMEQLAPYDNMDMYTFKGRRHSIQNDTFSGQFDYNGTMYNPLDWALMQERGTKNS